jgi:hypothetical protein
MPAETGQGLKRKKKAQAKRLCHAEAVRWQAKKTYFLKTLR